jgi:hypothetical protein
MRSCIQTNPNSWFLGVFRAFGFQNRTTSEYRPIIGVLCSRDFACVGGFPITRSCGDTSQNRERYLDFGFRISDFGFRISTRSGGGASQNRERSWNAGILPACVNRIERLGSSNAECGVRNAELHPDQSQFPGFLVCFVHFVVWVSNRTTKARTKGRVLYSCDFVCVSGFRNRQLTRTKHQIELANHASRPRG